MKEKDPAKFSWQGLFTVTALCFITFSGLIKLINGSADHSSLFLIIGFVTLILGGLFYLGGMIVKDSSGNEERKGFHRLSNED